MDIVAFLVGRQNGTRHGQGHREENYILLSFKSFTYTLFFFFFFLVQVLCGLEQQKHGGWAVWLHVKHYERWPHVL
jgi:hypothetical protein